MEVSTFNTLNVAKDAIAEALLEMKDMQRRLGRATETGALTAIIMDMALRRIDIELSLNERRH